MKTILLAAALSLAAAAPAPAQAGEPQAQMVGAFQYFENKDPITDANRSLLRTFDTQVEFMPAELYVQCADRGFAVAVTANLKMYATEQVQVIWRLDQNAPVTETWGIGEYKWVVAPDPQAFMEAAAGASRVAVRILDGAGTAETYIFPLQGLAEAMRKLDCPEF